LRDTFKLIKMDIKIFIQDMKCKISVSSKNNTRFSFMSRNNNTRFILLSQNNNTRFSLPPARAQAKSGVILQQIMSLNLIQVNYGFLTLTRGRLFLLRSTWFRLRRLASKSWLAKKRVQLKPRKKRRRPRKRDILGKL
jgi:hypothetical protein